VDCPGSCTDNRQLGRGRNYQGRVGGQPKQ
jgi:hypothetical protein